MQKLFEAIAENSEPAPIGSRTAYVLIKPLTLPNSTVMKPLNASWWKEMRNKYRCWKDYMQTKRAKFICLSRLRDAIPLDVIISRKPNHSLCVVSDRAYLHRTTWYRPESLQHPAVVVMLGQKLPLYSIVAHLIFLTRYSYAVGVYATVVVCRLSVIRPLLVCG